MSWYEISTSEIAPRQPLDSELFTKIRNSLMAGLSCIGLTRVIPNGSFEFTTGVVPLFWDISTHAGGSASISTGAHGAYSLRITHPGGNGNGGAEVWTQDYFPISGTALPALYFMLWASGTGVKGGIKLREYNSSYELLSTIEISNRSSFTATPTTFNGIGTIPSSNTRWGKLCCMVGTDSTVAGNMNFDMIMLDYV
jgi:hypothetical protein